MRHGDNKRKFGLERNQRRMLMKSLARSLVIHGKIETTLAKAKELRPYVEKLVTKALRNDIAAKRLAAAKIGTGQALNRLFKEVAPKYKTRQGGYTRVVKVWRPTKDGSQKAIIEFV